MCIRDSPNIVGVIDSGVVESGDVQLPYYVMPLVEGPSLRDLLEREGPMSVDEALRLAAEVADALDFAHARGVVHRDVKPATSSSRPVTRWWPTSASRAPSMRRGGPARRSPPN